MEVEKNKAIIVPTAQQSNTGTNKPLGSATRFDWQTHQPQQQTPLVPASESRTSQIRRNSLGQRHLSQQSKLCYRLADLVMMMVLIFPLVIAFWRGVWQLMDYHSKEWGIDPWLSMAVGYIIPLVLHLFQEPLKNTVCLEKMGFPLFYLLSRMILLIHSFGSVNQWRGLWQWMDLEFGLEWKSSLIIMLIGIAFSIVLKTLNNILAPPLFCVVDESKSIHDCPLRFKTSSKKRFQYFLDCIFSVIIVPAFVVCCWRGLWTLADLFLFPENEVDSALSSLCLGYAICVMLCLAQPSISHRVRNLKGFCRLAFVDTICVFGFVGCVLAWRGVWNSYNIFFAFETQNLSEWITTLVGALGTMILGCISVVVVRGIAIDGDLVEDGSAEWLIPYISVIHTAKYDVPYPEPWLCRYFCTSQKLGRRRRQGVKDSSNAVDPTGKEAGKPLKLGNAIGNSVGNADEYPSTRSHKLCLSDLPNIDSSSEEELGMRTRMVPPDDDIYNDTNNGADELEQDGRNQPPPV